MIKKITLCLIINCALIIIYCEGQTTPGIQWQNTIGGSGGDVLNYTCLKQTKDGGYVLGGSSESNISGDKTENCLGGADYWIVKVDSVGNIQWQNTIGGNRDDYLGSVQQTSDGGYILGGQSNSNISGDKTENDLDTTGLTSDGWIVKLDSIGNIQWQNTIGGNMDDGILIILQTNEGGYIMGGNSYSGISGDKTENNVDPTNSTSDYWIIKTDSVGNIQWQNTIGGNDIEEFYSIEQTTDGGYIIGGSSNSNISGDKTHNNVDPSGYSYDFWIVKTDSIGNIQWENTIGGSGWDKPGFTQQTKDGGYMVYGWSTSNVSGDKTENSIGANDYWIVKTNGVGNIQWQNTIGGSGSDWLYSLQQTTDGGYILGGHSSSNISGDKTENNLDSTGNSYDYWVVKTDSTGNIQWQNTIGGNKYDELVYIQQTVDHGYILGGGSNSNISGDKTENSMGGYDYWIVKLTPDTITGVNNISTNNNFNVYPNPFNGELAVSSSQFPKEKNEIKIYNVFGKKILSQTCTTANCKLATANLSPGVYFVKVNNEIKKVVKIK